MSFLNLLQQTLHPPTTVTVVDRPDLGELERVFDITMPTGEQFRLAVVDGTGPVYEWDLPVSSHTYDIDTADYTYASLLAWAATWEPWVLSSNSQARLLTMLELTARCSG